MLDEREAFLRAIFDAPDDDLPRLAYADWLEDHDDGVAAKAVRLSVEWARATQADQVASFDEIKAYYAEHAVALRPLAGLLRWPLVREEDFGPIRVTVADLADPAQLRQTAVERPWWFGQEMLVVYGRGNRITDASPFDTLFGAIAFRKVTWLILAGDDVPITGTVTDASGSLTELPAFDSQIVPVVTLAGVEALASHRGVRRLTELDLRYNNLGNDALRFLANSRYLDNLRRLQVAEGNNFRGRVWQLLIQRFGEDVVS